MATKLLDEYPMLVLPSLAKAIGLNEAIVIQQIHFYTESNKRRGREDQNFRDGRWWCWNTIEGWQREFCWWSKNTVWRTLKSLREKGLILAEKHSSGSSEHTLWYAIDYDAFRAAVKAASVSPDPFPQNGENRSHQNGENRSHQNGENNIRSRDNTETNTETNAERLRASAPTPAGLEVCDGDNPEERMDDAYSETDRTQYVLKMAHAHGIKITIGSAMGLAKKVWTELGEEARNYIEVRTAELASADIHPRYFARFMGEDLQKWKDRAAADKVARPVGRDDEDLSFLDGL